MFWKFVLFCLIATLIYLSIQRFKDEKILLKINKYIKEKNDKYYEDFIKNYEKNKKIKLVDKINVIYKLNLIIERSGLQRGILMNPISIILYGILCVIVAYKLSFDFFRIISLSIIISLPCIFIPIFFINYIGNYKEEKIEKVFLNFLLQIKNYTRINNDIVIAFKEVETIEPLQSYINKFNVEINSGVKFESAIEHIKEKIEINKIKEFFSNLQYCYLYGGNFSELIDKNYKKIAELYKEKRKRQEETKGARLVLVILSALNLFVYITYIKNNYDNYLIMQRSVLGMGILYWNFISMWFLLWMSTKVKKLDY